MESESTTSTSTTDATEVSAVFSSGAVTAPCNDSTATTPTALQTTGPLNNLLKRRNTANRSLDTKGAEEGGGSTQGQPAVNMRISSTTMASSSRACLRAAGPAISAVITSDDAVTAPSNDSAATTPDDLQRTEPQHHYFTRKRKATATGFLVDAKRPKQRGDNNEPSPSAASSSGNATRRSTRKRNPTSISPTASASLALDHSSPIPKKQARKPTTKQTNKPSNNENPTRTTSPDADDSHNSTTASRNIGNRENNRDHQSGLSQTMGATPSRRSTKLLPATGTQSSDNSTGRRSFTDGDEVIFIGRSSTDCFEDIRVPFMLLWAFEVSKQYREVLDRPLKQLPLIDFAALFGLARSLYAQLDSLFAILRLPRPEVSSKREILSTLRNTMKRFAALFDFDFQQEDNSDKIPKAGGAWTNPTFSSWLILQSEEAMDQIYSDLRVGRSPKLEDYQHHCEQSTKLIFVLGVLSMIIDTYEEFFERIWQMVTSFYFSSDAASAKSLNVKEEEEGSSSSKSPELLADIESVLQSSVVPRDLKNIILMIVQSAKEGGAVNVADSI